MWVLVTRPLRHVGVTLSTPSGRAHSWEETTCYRRRVGQLLEAELTSLTQPSCRLQSCRWA